VLLRLRYWAKKPYKIATIESAVRTRIREMFAAADGRIEMAYPHQHLVFDETSGEAQVAVREAAASASTDTDAEEISMESVTTAPGSTESTRSSDGSNP